ncbi:MAG: response regulator [Actinobacteria bacterium]|nr:response regulator [Actinomycetota bacterium]MCL5446030.1 response regulator [Actinomycetota bacterium]
MQRDMYSGDVDGGCDLENARRVVIAEDEAIIRLDLRESLEEDGFDVVGETGRGDEVPGIVEKTRPDLAILDIKMPGMDGIEVARQIKERYGTPALLLTAFSQRSLIEEARDAGVLAYLVKPFQRRELTTAVADAFARFEEEKAIDDEEKSRPSTSGAIEDKLETRRLVDEAKVILEESFNMDEARAFRYIQQTAMDSRTRMMQVARRIIDGELRPGSDLSG